MKCSIYLTSLITTTYGFTLWASAAERSVPCTTLPAAVRQSSKAEIADGIIHNCVRDVSKGVTTYEIETLKDGRSKDITVSANGEVLELEEQVDLASVPASVASAIQKRAAGGKIGKIESLTRNGKLVSYETVISRAGKHQEFAFDPHGAVIKAD